MTGESFLGMRCLRIMIILIAFSILYPISVFAAENLQKPDRVVIKNNLVSLDVEDAQISDILHKVEAGSNVKIIVDQSIKGKKVSAKFENKTVEESLREILRDQYYVLYFAHDPENLGNKVLKEAKVMGSVLGSKPMKGKLITIDIPYGKGRGEVGASKESEGGSRGPLSFAVDGKGNIYICDTANKRVQVFSLSGAYLHTIQLQENIYATDIVVDDHGFVYVYDRGAKKIYQHNKRGEVKGTIDVDRFWGAAGPLRFINNVIYMDYCDANLCSYFVVGRVLPNNLLVGRSEEEIKIPYKEQQQGAIALSGKRYKGRKFVEGYNTQLDIIAQNGLTSTMLSLPSKGGVLGDLFGEDVRGFFYFATGRDDNKLYDVDKFDAEGNYISTAKIPSGHLEFWAVKEFELNKNGNIYHFVPGARRLTIHVFVNHGS